jgi:glutamate--cysteine ligase
MIQDIIHRQIVANCGRVEPWFVEKSRSVCFPIYSSYDMRDAGFKIANVDANIFPAGFNNICQADKETAVAKVDEYLKARYGTGVKNLVLLAEEHTNNPYYWDNILTLRKLVTQTGREVKVALPRLEAGKIQVDSHSGEKVDVVMATRDGDGINIDGFKPDLVICNNDFSNAYEDWANGLKTPMNPPRELGWYRRRKDAYFHFYNEIVGEFANLLGIDPWLLQVQTQKFDSFNLADESSVRRLSEVVDEMLSGLRREYVKRNIEGEPFAFVKNNSGTYGLAVIQVRSGQAVLDWNYKSRKKMKAAKGGRDVEEVIIQEGIPTILKYESSTAEPTIYMIGPELAGGFLRTHGEKGPDESLNSPGAVYKKLCISDLKDSSAHCPMENVYGWLARLSALAVGLETKSMGVSYPGYKTS